MLQIVLLLYSVQAQPYNTACGTTKATYYQQIVPDTPILSGLGLTPASTTDYIQYQPTLTASPSTFLFDTLDTWTINLWFRPAVKHTVPSDTSEATKPEQALFRISMDTSDESLITNQGVRLGMYYTADYSQTTQFMIRYAKASTPYVALNSPFPYLEDKWCFGSASISYSQGKVSYYAFQPSSPNLIVNPQPVTEAVNFHTALTKDAVMQIFYWGTSYQYHYGDVRSISILKDYVELQYKNNWFYLMFMDNSYSVSLFARYRLEEMTGQIVYNKVDMTIYGYLGTTSATESSDPVWGTTIGLLQFGSAKQVKIPGIQFGSSNAMFGVALWFKTNAVLSGDADNVDLTKDLCVFRRNYQGTTEVLTLLFYLANAAQFGTKLKIGSTIFSPANIVHSTNAWHHITVSLLYPGAITELTQIMYDITLEGGIYQSHQATGLSSTYQESTTDTIILGSTLNSFSTGSLLLSNVNFYNKYSAYVDEDGTDTNYLNCNNDCQVSLNSISSQICLMCKNTLLMNEGNCVASCTTGPNALSNTASTVQVCRSCDFKCSSCNSSGACSACNTGFYLVQPAANACVTSANCGGTYVGNPTTGLCTKCGNGVRDTGESCDEGKLLLSPPQTNGPGCVACLVNSPTYKCSRTGPTSATPDICYLACGDHIFDSGEICDDGNNIDGDGCSADCSQIEALYYCLPSAAPIDCYTNCGNGSLESSSPDNEECDVGTPLAYDGCTDCKIDIGYECDNSYSSPVSHCDLICSNGVINAGEDCDDQNTINGDGCSDCVVDSGWSCTGAPSTCVKTCGNGVRDSGEECDDGNSVNNDGCTSCKIDTDYLCVGGTTTTADKCTAIPDICGDGILRSTEECDDGNTVSGDGCSKSCKIEIGYSCSSNICNTICGDGLRIALEGCDDGNVLGGDGCNEVCSVENLYRCSGGSSAGKDSCIFICGDGTRDASEECDDGNIDDGDGCSQFCAIETGYGCIAQELSHDTCFKCITNCGKCQTTTACSNCYTGFYELGTMCFPGCPSGYYSKDNSCEACADNCSQCISATYCVRCNYDHYLQNKICYSKCPTGYYDKPNAMSGNQCTACTSPCDDCDSTTCYGCIDKYYLDSETSTCVSCNMGDYCLKCDNANGVCLSCSEGYYRDGNTCLEIPLLCGDGLHNPSERCDDGNITPLDGCDEKCKIELNWDCVLYDLQGPDVCFLMAPPSVTYTWSKVYSNIIYLSFSRPMQEGIDYSSLTEVVLPDLASLLFKEFDPVNDEGIIIQHDKSNAFVPYEYTTTSFSNQTIQITFSYQLTIQNLTAMITFINASNVIDIYNWSLVDTASDSRRILATTTENYTLEVNLPYFIYYSSGEKQISDGIAFFLFIVCIIGLISGFYYYYKIGEGRIRKTIEFVQIVSMLRFINYRMGYNMEATLKILDFFNLTFIPNIFDLIQNDCDQFNAQGKFQYYNYNTQMLSEGGGRMLTAFAALLIILGINELMYRFVPHPDIEYYCEQVHKYFRCQGMIVFIEIFFLDFMISIVLNLANPDTTNIYGCINLIVCILFIIAIIAAFTLVQVKLVRNPHLSRVRTVYEYFGELFDGLLFTTAYTKFFSLVPYCQKIITALALVLLPPLYQIGLIILARLMFYSLSANIIPIYYIEIFIKEVAYDCSMTIITASMLAYNDDASSKDQKMIAGWGISSVVLITMGLQIFFVRYAISIIDRMIPPFMPDHEEIAQQDQDLGNKDIHILQQAVEMEKMENGFFGGH